MANNGFFKKVYVLITTHNRTNVACACIESLVNNLKYGNLGWIVSDDRSEPGHVEALVSKFDSLGIKDVTVCRTDTKRFGLGASMNNGLKAAFKGSDVVLTTEDDWFLQKELRLEPYVRLFDIDQNVGCIRFGPMMYAKLTRHHRYKIFDKVYSDGGLYTSVFNNQVALRHRRIYQRLGAYKENCPCDVSEQDMIARYNCGCGLDVLYPNFMKVGTMDDPSLFFIHVGKSTIGHDKYRIPERFGWIYDEEKNPVADVNVVTPQKIEALTESNPIQSNPSKKLNESDLPVVTVVMTTHNRTNVACAVIDSLVKNLKYPKLKWCISDDRSENGHVEKLVQRFSENGITCVHIERTDNRRWGLGASLNNGLRYAWTNSDIVLTTEDDWILQKQLSLEDFISHISDPKICCIRLAAVDQSTVEYYDDKYRMITSSGNDRSTFNLQVALRHKRIYDKIGYYKEDNGQTDVERDMVYRYNKYTNNGYRNMYTLFPNEIKLKTYDDESLYFIHIGMSVSGHTKWKVPERYNYIYEDQHS